jgi:hypothetical protein
MVRPCGGMTLDAICHPGVDARVRGAVLAVDALLDEFSAVTVAAHLGVSRQKVYDLSRPTRISSYIDGVPWRQS